MTVERGRLVRVYWDDAEDPDSEKSWLTEEDVETFSKVETLVVSYGLVISHTDKYLTLGADWIERLKHWGRVTKITCPQIVEIEEIEER